MNRLKIFYSIRSVIWSGSYSTPPKKQSNNNHNNAKEILTGGLSHHLFACHAQQLQNVYNRRSVIFLWGVFFFLTFSTVVYHFLPISCVCVCRGWHATWALLTSDVVTDHKKSQWTKSLPSNPSNSSSSSSSFLFHKCWREDDDFIPCVCGWPHFGNLPRSSVVVIKRELKERESPDPLLSC